MAMPTMKFYIKHFLPPCASAGHDFGLLDCTREPLILKCVSGGCGNIAPRPEI
jgi:hypothetical protein